MDKQAQYVTLGEASKMAKRSIVWMRRLCTEQRLDGKKDDKNDWLVSVESIAAYMKEVDVKEALRLQKIEEGYKYPYTRPRVAAVKMMREAVTEFAADDAEAAVLNRFLSKVEHKWTAEYEKKYS